MICEHLALVFHKQTPGPVMKPAITPAVPIPPVYQPNQAAPFDPFFQPRVIC